MRNFTDPLHCVPLSFLNSGLGFCREEFFLKKRGGTEGSVFRDTGKGIPKGGQLLGTLSIIMVMKTGNTI